MLRVTLRSFWAHKRRLISTVLAVVLGVAFLTGTFVLTDTLDRVFDDLFAESNAKVDTQVQGEVLFSDPIGGEQRSLLDAGLTDKVAAVDGVASAVPFVNTIGFGSTNRVIGPDGKPLGAAQGPPTLIESWVTDSQLTPYVVQDGRGPETDREIALNVAAIEDAGFSIGDEVTVVTQFGSEDFTLVGAVTFGTAKSSTGAVSAEFTLAQAQRLAGTGDRIQLVLARGGNGLSEQETTDRIARVLPATAQAITGTQAAAQLSANVQTGFAFFKILLSVFGAIALVVGIFVISNTFAILVAQRTKELALLRAVGASRPQVLSSVLLEATLIGLVAATLGLTAGIGLAKGVTWGLDRAGAELPVNSLLVRPRIVAIAFALGLVVTLVAALLPAIRATRVPPLAALRDVAIDRSNTSRGRQGLGLVALAAGAYALSAAWIDGSSDALPRVGAGALLVIVGAIVMGPLVAAPSVRAIGYPIGRLAGITGRLATENAARSPKRTSATASALIIGVALVGFITVFATSATRSVTAAVERGFTGDFVVQSSANGFGIPTGFPTSVATTTAAVDGVQTLAPLSFGRAEFTYPDQGKSTEFLTSVDPKQISKVLDIQMAEGEVADLTDGGIIVDTEVAKTRRLAIGDPIIITGAGGDTLAVSVEAISDDAQVLGTFTVTRTAYARLVPEVLDVQLFGKVTSGQNIATVIANVETAIAGTPSLQVLDRDAYIGELAKQITSFVTFIYGLLILSIIIALIGIANTLSLSINERTRELGLLRAVGMDRRQLRSTIRWEAVVISLLGTFVGLGLGLLLSWALITALRSQGLTTFAVPVGSLVAITVLSALLGTMASILPARRAARLAILDAISSE